MAIQQPAAGLAQQNVAPQSLPAVEAARRHWRAGDRVAAIATLRNAVTQAPSDARLAFELALALKADWQIGEALPWLRRAVALEPDWIVPANELAWILATHPSGEVRDASAAVEIAQRLAAGTAQRDPAVLDTLAAAYANAGRFDEAVGVIGRAIALLIGERDARIRPGAASARLPQYQQRRTLYASGIPFRETELPRAALDELVAQYRQQPISLDEVMHHYAEGVGRLAHWEPIVPRLAWIFATHDDPRIRRGDVALRLAHRLVEYDGSRADWWDLLAAAQAACGRFDHAQMALTEAARRAAAGGPPLHETLANRRRQYAAQLALHRAPPRPFDPPPEADSDRARLAYVHYLLASALREEGHLAAAAAALEAAVAHDPGDVPSHADLGHLLWQLGEHRRGSDHLSIALARGHRDPLAAFKVAIHAKAEGNFARAARHLREAVRMRPAWIEDLNELAWLLATCQDAHCRSGNEALEVAQRMFEAGGSADDPWLLSTLAAAHAETGQFDQAVAVQRRAMACLQHDDSGPPEAPRRAWQEVFQHRLELYGAGRPFRELQHFDPVALAQLAQHYRRQGQTQRAVACLREAAAQHPGDLRLVNELAWTLATDPAAEPADCREALGLAAWLAEVSRRREPAILDTLAAAYARLGHFEPAIDTLRQAVALLHADESSAARRHDYLQRIELYQNGRAYFEGPALR